MLNEDSGVFRLAARFVAWVIVEFVYEIGFQLFCTWAGRLALLLLTLGKFPSSQQAEDYEVLIGLFGLALIFGLAFLSFEYLSYSNA